MGRNGGDEAAGVSSDKNDSKSGSKAVTTLEQLRGPPLYPALYSLGCSGMFSYMLECWRTDYIPYMCSSEFMLLFPLECSLWNLLQCSPMFYYDLLLSTITMYMKESALSRAYILVVLSRTALINL